jgi:membrane dipeptidase
MSKIRAILIAIAALGGAALLTRRFAAALIERSFNRVLLHPPYAPDAQSQAIHQRAFIADLHADSLATGRNLLFRSTRGHVDLPRLLDGNVGLQVFGVVTKSPSGQNVHATSEGLDMLTGAAVISGWPRRAWGNLLERALYQAARLRCFAEQSQGRLVLVGNQLDLQNLLARRAAGERAVGAFLGLEGVHALRGQIANLERLFTVGFRMIGMTHFFDNQAGGSAHGLSGAGLTDFGCQVVRQAQERGMLVDLAHASPQMMRDVLKMTRSPVVVSHTGVRATLDTPRNLDDDQLRAIAANGGVIGIAVFQTALGGSDLSATARAMRHVADLAGVDCLALGTDFDGGVTTFTDASGLPLLTAALLREGFSEEEVLKILGGNFLRVLKQILI